MHKPEDGWVEEKLSSLMQPVRIRHFSSSDANSVIIEYVPRATLVPVD
jgi:hypothetical protein